MILEFLIYMLDDAVCRAVLAIILASSLLGFYCVYKLYEATQINKEIDLFEDRKNRVDFSTRSSDCPSQDERKT